MNKAVRIIGILVLVFLLITVRIYETTLFYDPFTHYFKNDYLHKVLPEYDSLKLFGNIVYRYVLNAILSLGIIYLVFLDKKHLKFAIQFYGIALLVLSLLLNIMLQTQSISYLPIFYVRRFLIQPIFVLLLIPAFYYQKQHVKT